MLHLKSNYQSVIVRLALLFLATLLVTGGLASCSRDQKSAPKPRARPSGTEQAQIKQSEPDVHNLLAVIETAKGTMEIEFYPDDAPKTVENFIKNVRLKFYDGEAFHRVEPGLLIQAGSRLVTDTIPMESNNRKHVRGAVAMAKEEGATNSDASEFYICLDALPNLDGKYTVFGHVTKGLDVLDKIAKDDKIVKITLREKK